MHVQVLKRPVQVAIVFCQNPGLQQEKGIFCTLGKRSPADPIRHVQTGRAGIGLGSAFLQRFLGLSKEMLANILLNPRARIRPAGVQVGPAGIRIGVLPGAPAPDVVMLLPPRDEPGAVFRLSGGPVQFCCRPKPVVPILRVVVFPGNHPLWIAKASRGEGIGMALQEFPAPLRPFQEGAGDLLIVRLPDPGGQGQHGCSQGRVVSRHLKQIARFFLPVQACP